VRLFVALDVPAGVRQALGELIDRLKPQCRGARWVRSEGIHVTLKFIGHVGDQDTMKIQAIRAALAKIQSDHPVGMRFRGIGFFPDARRPRVAWCGVETSGNLAPLAAAIENVLEPLGIERESREFSPHLTLARISSHDGLAPLVREAEKLKGADFGAARESEFHLFNSVTKPAGAEYTKIETYSFVKAVNGAA
jgi:RNA 2',3'-cyclic 3'-phosphodiesterase